MSNILVWTMDKGIRFDLTCAMRDADLILKIMKSFSVTFEKKYTTIHNDTPSTITFKRIQCDHGSMNDFLNALNAAVQNREFSGNVYIHIVNWFAKKPRKPQTADITIKPGMHSTIPADAINLCLNAAVQEKSIESDPDSDDGQSPDQISVDWDGTNDLENDNTL